MLRREKLKLGESFEHLELRRYSDSPGGKERERERICKGGKLGCICYLILRKSVTTL